MKNFDLCKYRVASYSVLLFHVSGLLEAVRDLIDYTLVDV